jgi:hypothetical protein
MIEWGSGKGDGPRSKVRDEFKDSGSSVFPCCRDIPDILFLFVSLSSELSLSLSLGARCCRGATRTLFLFSSLFLKKEGYTRSSIGYECSVSRWASDRQ